MAAFEHRYWSSADGLRLHARDYPGGEDGRPVLLCLPGLTRNARDYDALAMRLAGRWRVVAVDLRGRGGSEYAKDAMTYVPAAYVADVAALLGELGVAAYAVIGTSLGGLIAMLIAGQGGPRLAGAVINDVGPKIEAAGLARIRGYVGKGSSFPTWMHAARAVADANADVYPAFGIDDWLGMAKRLYRLTSAGRIVLDYDLRIAEPMRATATDTPPDLWPALANLRDIPVLIVRGGRSDVLSAATAQRMTAALGADAELVTVPGVGHAPTLAEEPVQAPLDRWLDRVAAR